MSLERYDKALEEKLKKVFPHVLFSPLSQVLQNAADLEVKIQTHDGENEVKTKHSQKVALPLIAFDRINNPPNFEFSANDPAIRRGRHRIIEEEHVRERTLPVNIQYQIDILSDRRVEVDGIWREVVMFLYLQPNVKVQFEYEGSIVEEEFPLKIMETDNTTDVEDFSDKGRLYRQTLNLEIPQAKLLFDKKISLIKEFPVHVIELGDEGDED